MSRIYIYQNFMKCNYLSQGRKDNGDQNSEF